MFKLRVDHPVGESLPADPDALQDSIALELMQDQIRLNESCTQTSGQSGTQTDKHQSTQTDKQSGTQTYRQSGTHTSNQAGRPAVR